MVENHMSLTGKKVIITGASGGLGSATTKALLANGALVLGTSLPGETIDISHENLITHVADLRLERDVRHVFDTASSHWDSLDIVINNAGVCPFGPIVSEGFEAMRDALLVNLRAVFLCSQLAARSMRRQQSGLIINISSNIASGPAPHLAIYCSTKRAVTVISEALGQQLAPFGVQVVAFEPGAIDTPLSRSLRDQLDTVLPSEIERIPAAEVAEAIVSICRTGRAFDLARVCARTRAKRNST